MNAVQSNLPALWDATASALKGLRFMLSLCEFFEGESC
jgi:hypothetical protein